MTSNIFPIIWKNIVCGMNAHISKPINMNILHTHRAEGLDI